MMTIAPIQPGTVSLPRHKPQTSITLPGVAFSGKPSQPGNDEDSFLSNLKEGAKEILLPLAIGAIALLGFAGLSFIQRATTPPPEKAPQVQPAVEQAPQK